MTVKEFMHRWILGCTNKPLFYLPFHRSLGKVIIEPMSHIYERMFDNKQFFVPYCDQSQLTGTIYLQKSGERIPTKGCEYRIYKKVKTSSGKYKYISVLENGILDPDEKADMFKNKVELNLPAGTYYYKEFISGEGDILHFDIEKFTVKANEITNLIIDHEPKLVQTFLKFTRKEESFRIDRTSGGESDPDGYGEFGENITYWGVHVLFAPTFTRSFTIGTTHDNHQEEIVFDLRNDLNVKTGGLTQRIKHNPNEKIIPEFTRIVYMGKDFSDHLHQHEVYNDSTRKVWFNLSRQKYVGSGSVGSDYNNYYTDFYNINLLNYTKCNPDWYYDDILIHTGYMMLYHDYQIFNKSSSYNSLYNKEEYNNPNASIDLTTKTYQGFYIQTRSLKLAKNYSLDKYSYYGHLPVSCCISEENEYAGGGIYILEVTSPIWKSMEIHKAYELNQWWDYAYNIDVKQGRETYYCEEHHKYETRYFLEGNTIPQPQLVDTTMTETEHGGGVARGYAAAEDIGGASMWICKAVTESDPDTNGGYSPPYAAPNLGLYFTVTLYYNEDGTYYTVPQTYSLYQDLLFPEISPHVYKQKKNQYVYSQLDKFKDCVETCNCAVVFVRQTREHYRDWFRVKEPDDWER